MTDAVAPDLAEAVGWECGVLFIVNRWITYRLPWGLFLRYWRHFLRMNDGPVLVQPGDIMYVRFASTGETLVGFRKPADFEWDIEWVEVDSVG